MANEEKKVRIQRGTCTHTLICGKHIYHFDNIRTDGDDRSGTTITGDYLPLSKARKKTSVGAGR